MPASVGREIDMLKTIKRSIPTPFKNSLIHLFLKIKHFGLSRYCPLCNSYLRKFETYGSKHRQDARCPVCKALERHRFLWLLLQKNTTLLDKTTKKILCFALEPFIEKKLQTIDNLEYIYVDLYNPNAMQKMDITNIEFPDESFDAVYCSHVLEHVDNDRKAISEMHRVLKKTGQAIILVPISATETFENPDITDSSERTKVFGQHDHVRAYGPDFKDRLEEAGFNATDYYIKDLFTEKQIQKLGLKYIISDNMPIYLCQKTNR